MQLTEIIKSLKPAERLKAFIFLALLTSGTAVATAYFKTDDCKDVSNNYSNCIENYSKASQFANSLMAESNAKTNDLIILSKLLDSLHNAKSVEYITTLTNKDATHDTLMAFVPDERVSAIVSENNTENNERPIVAASRIERPEVKQPTTTIVEKHKIIPLRTSHKKIVDSANNILKKYKQK